MHLRSVRRRYTCTAILLTLGIVCTVWIDPRQTGSTMVWSLVILFLAVLFFRQSQALQSAKLIWDNRILVIPGDHLDTRSEGVDETIISTFGILSADRIYEWGRRGLWGNRLRTMEVDQRKMGLSFGNKRQAIWLEFEHGMDSQEQILEVAQTLWKETGVRAVIRG